MRSTILIMASGIAAAAGNSNAQDPAYPSKPVYVVSPLGSGGAVEILGHIVTKKLTENTGRSWIIDSRPGAGGTIGMEYAAKAAPDGYTLLLTSASYSMIPWLYKINYDAARDLVPVGQISASTSIFIVPASLPANNLKEFIALAKARPGALNYGSSGVGSSVHFNTERLALAAGIKLTHIAYKVPTQSYADLMSGQLQAIMSSTISALPALKSGKAKALGVTSTKRLTVFPDVPTLAEAGVPGFSIRNWTGIFGPGKMPAGIQKRVTDELMKVTDAPEYKKMLESQGSEPNIPTLEQFKQTVQEDLVINGRIAKEADIKAE